MSWSRARRRVGTGAGGVVAAATLLLAAALGFAALGRGPHAPGHPLPILGRVTDFALVDQTSAPVGRAALDGAPWVASFVFTRCPLVCPRISDRMRALRALAQHRTTALHLVTFSVDPEHDVPDVLRSYAEAYGADRATWRFLTGSEAQVEAVARSFSVGLEGEADPTEADFGIMHSGHLVLIDGRGRIRGYYPSSEDGVEQRILADLERLEVS